MAKRRTGDWRAAYRRQLERLYDSGHLQEIVNSMPENSVLMCYEADEGDCHRKVLGDYINEKGLAVVSEFPYKAKAKKDDGGDAPQRVLL